MARNRQRAKERQARRRAEGGDGEAAPPPERLVGDERLEEAELRAGAPPHDLGRSDEVLGDVPDVEDDEEHFDPVEDEPEDETEAEAAEPAGRGGRDASQDADRPRLVQFLFAVRAELGRVQWPDRQATTTLTGVVLGFVILAGGYLGLLDFIFGRLIQAIL